MKHSSPKAVHIGNYICDPMTRPIPFSLSVGPPNLPYLPYILLCSDQYVLLLLFVVPAGGDYF